MLFVVEAVELAAAGAASLCESFVVQELLLLELSQVLRLEWQLRARISSSSSSVLSGDRFSGV